MDEFPDFTKAFKYENEFYLSCGVSRIAKLLSHCELYKMVLGVPGVIVECGVFKGVSLSRFAMFRELFEKGCSRKIVGFDSFDVFPETDFEPDKPFREEFIECAGRKSISIEQMKRVLLHKGCGQNVELVAGDICKTVPEYLEKNPSLKIAFLNLDTDIYEPAVTILKHLWPRITKGGILILDNYGVFPGETKAINDYFKNKTINFRKPSLSKTICYIQQGGKS